VIRAADKYLVGFGTQGEIPSVNKIRQFIAELQDTDLYLSLACAQGNEQAWWQFDRLHRSFIERLARRLVRSGMDADEVIDSVYFELFGTKTVDEVRQSKFRTYTGRGTLRGWLRTIIWHSVVDLHRKRHDEIPLEEWSASGEESRERQAWRADARTSDDVMLANIVRERFRAAALAALDHSLATLDDHETLLLLYYHVEGLKLREIARLVEEPASPIRRWFQRQARRGAGGRASRVHESTVMRWLDKVYRKISERFRSELANTHGLNPAQIEICLAVAAEDLAQAVKLNPVIVGDKTLNKGEAG
jgi:RNA polymerase sigma-70 factor